MNQINLRESAGIDTDEVQYWSIDPETTYVDEPRTFITFKNGKEVMLRGDAKAAFDAWAESLRPVPEPGQRELCAKCGWRNVRGECVHHAEGAGYPECFEDINA